MKKRKYLIMAISVMVLFVTSINMFAMFGDAKTKTKSANAEMNLGEYKGVKHAVAVKDFDIGSWWHRGSEWNISHDMSLMLESALYDSGRFVVVDRDNETYRYWYATKNKGVTTEQDLAASGRTAPASKVAQKGKMRPARYLAQGDITELTENQSGADGGIGFKGVRLGGGKSDAQITIIVKLIDTTTGEIVAKERIIGKAGNTSAKVGLSFHGLNTKAGGHKKTPLAQAAQDCINQAVVFMVKAMKELPREGSVIKATSKGVIINRGSTYGVEIGQELIMQEEGEELMDPGTGEILGMEEGDVIGKLKVKTVKEKYSYCSVVDGEASPQPSTVVIFVDQKK